jgi:putative hydrolases of HD superfamily
MSRFSYHYSLTDFGKIVKNLLSYILNSMMTKTPQSGNSLLKFEKIAPEIYARLQAIKRTGWVEKGVHNPESVKEHTLALIKLALELTPRLTPEETDGLAEMLEVHDWPEALHGDEVILELDSSKRQQLKAIKFEKEKRALETLCAHLPNKQEILDLWLRFETSDDPASVFARQLDKYQAVELALEYEEAQSIPLFEEFLTYSINFINHPVLLGRIKNLEAKWQTMRGA